MTAHTPGPWFLINEHCVGGPIEPGWEAAGSGIAHCGMRARTEEEAKANALLIVAAPDLFAALELMLRYADIGPAVDGVAYPEGTHREAMKRARNALWKARYGEAAEQN